MKNVELISNASQTASLLVEDLLVAHKCAIRENPVAEILLSVLLDDAREFRNRIYSLEIALGAKTE